VARKAKKTIKTENKVVGYIRISTDTQDSERQKVDILEYANINKMGSLDFVSEVISSRKEERKIFKLIEKLESGDKIIVTELSRIGRSMKDINFLVSQCKQKNIDIHVIVDNLIITNIGNKDDVMRTDIMIFALSIAAQIERNLISERTKSALKRLKQGGVILGRPAGKGRKLEEYFKAHPLEKERYERLFEFGVSITKISKALNMNRLTVTAYFKNHKEIK